MITGMNYCQTSYSHTIIAHTHLVTTGVAPNQIIFGKLIESATDRRLNIRMYLADRSSVENRAAENIRQAQHHQKHPNDKRVNKYPTFNVNQ